MNWFIMGKSTKLWAMTALLYIYVAAALSLVACSNDNPVTPDADESTVTIPMSEEAAEMRADIKAAGGQKYIFTEETWPVLMEYSQSQSEQEYPEVETMHRQDHMVIADNDVYTIENDNAACLVIYLHGGAYCFGILDSHIEFCDKLAHIDQGDRSLISYFERGREFGVRATSVFSCAINPLKILPYFIYDSIGQSADTNHLTWTCSKFTHHVTDTRGTVLGC